MPPATQRTQKKRPGDLTGVRGQALAQEAANTKAEEVKLTQEALQAEREQKRNTEVDYSSRPKTEVREVATDDGVQVEEISVEVPTRRIRVNYPIEQMTFGREIISNEVRDKDGNVVQPAVLGSLREFTFEEGRWYTVDADVASHLEFLGYVYDDGR